MQNEVITIRKGLPWREQWALEDEEGTVVDLTGSSVVMLITEKDGEAALQPTITIETAASGYIRSELTEEQVDAITWRVGHLEIIHTDSGGVEQHLGHWPVVMED